MYKQHFGFLEKPFGIAPDPAFLYFSSKHKVAFSMLEYGFFEQDGITVITGEVGVGKTTLVQFLLNRIDYSRYTIGLINNTHRSLGTMLQWIALALKIETDGKDGLTLFKDIQEFLIDEYANGRNTVLIVDEAQNLNKDALEELRLLTNINAQKDQLLKIILVGQPQLHELLMDPDLAQVCQRISSEYHLGPLNQDDVCEYVNHRLRHAGAGRQIFDEQAVKAVHYFSYGIPRLINKLCDYALVVGFAKDRLTIDLDTILEVIRDNKLGGFRKRVLPTNAEMAKRAREIIEAREAEEVREAAMEAMEAREAKEAREAREAREAKEAREAREAKEAREAREAKEAIENTELSTDIAENALLGELLVGKL